MPIAIPLPPSLANLPQEAGGGGAQTHDQRRHVRVTLRSVALARFARRLPSDKVPATWLPVVTRNVSKHGLSFYCAEHALPTERMWVLLLEEAARRLLARVVCQVVVRRCRRLAERRFEIGCEVLGSDDGVSAAPGIPAAILGALAASGATS